MHPTAAYPRRGIIVTRLAEAIMSRGHDVRMHTLGDSGSAIRYWRARTSVREAIQSYEPDLIHLHFGYSGLAVPGTLVPIVSSFYGDDLLGTTGVHGRVTLKSRLGICVSQITARRSRQNIVVSQLLSEALWGEGDLR